MASNKSIFIYPLNKIKKIAFLILSIYFSLIGVMLAFALYYPFNESACFRNAPDEVNPRFEAQMKRIANQDPGYFMEIYVKAFLIDNEGSLLFINPCENLSSSLNILKSAKYGNLEKKSAIIYMYKLSFSDYINFAERAYSLYKSGLINAELMSDVLNPREDFWPTISNFRWSPKWRIFLKHVKQESNNSEISKAVDRHLELDLLN